MALPESPGFHRLRVRAVVDETHDARSIVFDVPADLAGRFAYRPGQFVTLRLPVGNRVVRRCYSMSSAPALDAWPRITVKRVAGGTGSNWVCDRLQAGSEVEVMPPGGVFTPASLDTDLVLMAGGSGITPVFSILRSALRDGHGRLLLVYANRDDRSVIFRDALRQLAAEHAERLTVIHWLDSVQGLPSVAQLAELVRPWHAALAQPQAAQAFLCGPAAFMDGAAAALARVGLPEAGVHTERFVSLPDEGEAPVADAVASAEEAALSVELDGQTHRLHCRAGQTLLEAALAAGLNAPYSCQAGLCASCMCQVLEGSVHLRHNEALDAKDLARAWTLACQAVPTSAAVRVKFPG